VGQLRELTHLELQDNVALDNIPASFADLTKLVVFNFSNTAIPALPYELQFWTELTELTGTRNAQIEEVPGRCPTAADEQRCCSLAAHVASFSGTISHRAAAHIGKLTKLERLDLEGASLKKLPEEMGQLTQLKYVELRKNGLTTYTIPGTIENWKRITRLSFAYVLQQTGQCVEQRRALTFLEVVSPLRALRPAATTRLTRSSTRSTRL